MCIQSYYNQKDNGEENEIELDLLKEIRDVGIEEWNEQVSEKATGKNEENNKNR